MSKSECTKHTNAGPLLEVEMSKKCTSLWREAHFQVKMHKTHHVQRTFGSSEVEKVDAVVARSTFPSQKCKKLRGSDRFWTVRCRFAWHGQGILHLVKSERNLRVCRSFNYNHQHTTLHYTTLGYIPLHYTTLHHTKLHYTTLHYTTLHYTTLHYNALHHTTTTTTTPTPTTLQSTTTTTTTLQVQPQPQLQLHHATTTTTAAVHHTTSSSCG